MAFKFIARLFGGPKMEALPAGTQAPTFELTDAGGRSYSLAEALKQGPVLLAFFKTSCPTSQFTFPFLERLHRAIQGGNNARVWGISQDDARDTRDFARELGCTFPMLLDEDGYPVSKDYGLSYVPTLFLVERSGEVRLSSVGFEREGLEAAARAFGEAVGQPITVFHAGEPVPDYKPG